MNIFEISGFFIESDITGDPVRVGDSTLQISSATDSLNYELLAPVPGDLLEPVEITNIADFTLLDAGGFDLLAIGDEARFFIAELVTSNGRHVVLDIDLSFLDFEFFYVIGGDPLPSPTTPGEVDDLEASVQSFAPVTSGPLAPGQEIAFASLSNTVEIAPDEDMVIEGGPGPDVLAGAGGDDLINGGGGEDRLSGLDGDDTLRGGPGEDTLNGGAGDDSLVGQRGEDTLNGGGGNDTLKGGGGNDRLNGGAGNDFLKGGTADDVLNGGNGNDRIFGNRDDDTLNGGAGRDLLNGGGGDDRLTGGAGADTFVFADGHGDDTIRDFDAQDDNERIDLSRVSAITGLGDLLDNHTTQEGATVLIDTGGGNSILLQNVALGDLGAGDFLF